MASVTYFHKECSDFEVMPFNTDMPGNMIMQKNVAMRFNGRKRAVLSMQALD